MSSLAPTSSISDPSKPMLKSESTPGSSPKSFFGRVVSSIKSFSWEILARIQSVATSILSLVKALASFAVAPIVLTIGTPLTFCASVLSFEGFKKPFTKTFDTFKKGANYIVDSGKFIIHAASCATYGIIDPQAANIDLAKTLWPKEATEVRSAEIDALDDEETSPTL